VNGIDHAAVIPASAIHIFNWFIHIGTKFNALIANEHSVFTRNHGSYFSVTLATKRAKITALEDAMVCQKANSP
jgi:hypothetical protein